MGVTFLTPLGALAALAVLAPLAALVLARRRHDRVRAVLGLERQRSTRGAVTAVALIAAFALLGLAAAQPVAHSNRTASARVDAEAYAVFDITRSMLAAAGAGAPTRMERAVEAAIDLRAALPEVPFGIATITNRPLPHLFPTTDALSFARVARESIGVNRPPGEASALFGLATDFQTLDQIAVENYFSSTSRRRLLVLVTDGESRPFATRILVAGLESGGVDVIILRIWDADERVWQEDGTADPEYRPESISLGRLEELASLTVGGRVFAVGEVRAAAAAARAYLGRGPTVTVDAPGAIRSLAPPAVLAALALLALAAALAIGLPGRLCTASRARLTLLQRQSRHPGPAGAWRIAYDDGLESVHAGGPRLAWRSRRGA